MGNWVYNYNPNKWSYAPLTFLLPILYQPSQVSHEQKPSYFPLYWLVNRDGLLQSLYNWVVSPPIYTKQPGFFSLLKCAFFLQILKDSKMFLFNGGGWR